MSAVEPAPLDIAFECLPLRSLSRLDIPLDASEGFRARALRIRASLDRFGPERSYYLYNSRCVFRFANSEFEGVCRFAFEGTVRTDAGDRKFEHAELAVELVSETCGGVTADVEAWLVEQVRRAVAIEFDRFLAAGDYSRSADATVDLSSLGDAASVAGIDV